MSLDKLTEQLKNQDKLPPVELWDPPYCGELDIKIAADGQWYYNGSVFKRLSLVKLFASVLKKEHNDYFLVTPVEKVKITVEDAPFVLTQWHWQDKFKKNMVVSTNLYDAFPLDADHPMYQHHEKLYVTVRRNLTAKVHRNVYYQWADIAQLEPQNNSSQQALVFYSHGQRYCLGSIEL